MDEHRLLVERFEASRPHLRAVAYRMLGSPSEADLTKRFTSSNRSKKISC